MGTSISFTQQRDLGRDGGSAGAVKRGTVNKRLNSVLNVISVERNSTGSEALKLVRSDWLSVVGTTQLIMHRIL